MNIVLYSRVRGTVPKGFSYSEIKSYTQGVVCYRQVMVKGFKYSEIKTLKTL